MSKEKMTLKNGAAGTKGPFNIIVLGEAGSGKTTLIASIYQCLTEREDIHVLHTRTEQAGLLFLRKILDEAIKRGLFPPREEHFNSKPIEIILKREGIQDIYLKFLEIRWIKEQDSGFLQPPDFDNFEYEQSDELHDHRAEIMDTLRQTDLLVITVPVDEAYRSDFSMGLFFQDLYEKKIDIPIILVISKWDEWRANDKITGVVEFVRVQMPATSKWLKTKYFKDSKITISEVGEVVDIYNGSSKLDVLNKKEYEEIIDFIIQSADQAMGEKSKSGPVEEQLREKLARLEKESENIALLEEIRVIYLESGEETKVREIDKRIDRIKGEQEFDFNLGKRIVLEHLQVHDLDFFGSFTWPLTPGMNVLLGRNGYGKSHLLRLMAALLQVDNDKAEEYFKQSKKEPFASLVVDREEKQENILRNRLLFDESIGIVPLLALPDIRTLDQSTNVVSRGESPEDIDLKKNGAYHFLQQKQVERLLQDFLYKLCFAYLDKGKTFDIPIFQLIHRVMGKLSDQPFKFHEIAPINGQSRFKIEVITEGNDTPLPIQKASQGTLSVLAIFGLIYSYLKAVFPDVPEEELFQKPAIVLIDELDAHLHPAWQQKISGLLRENFPHIQFIVTAHSPLVVAGCKEGEVAVMRKEGDGFSVRIFDEDFIGYEAGEIFRKVFEVEEKDDNYLYYHALYPFQSEINKEISILEKEKASQDQDFPGDKAQKLDKLYEDLLYSNKARDRFEKRMDYSRVMIENRKLKSRLKKLEKEGG